MLTFERAHELLSYNTETGALSWRIDVGRRAKAVAIASAKNARGVKICAALEKTTPADFLV